MYDVLLYEVSFGDIGTCQPHEEARVTIAVVVVVTGAVKMSPTAAPANSRGIRNRTRPATAEWVLLVLLLSAINQLWPNSTNSTGEP